jgi:dihydrofolate synthase/folylpolyglutamate synthase
VILYGKNPILEDIATQRDSPVIFPQDRDIKTNLLGEHQISNGRIAYEAGVFLHIPEDTIEHALMHVHHDGRLQYVLTNLLIDGAHNEDGLTKLENYLYGEQEKWKDIIYCANLRT